MNKSSQKDFNMKSVEKPSQNPLVETSTNKLSVPPLDKIKPEHFIPAIQWGITQAQTRIAAIKSEREPTFENVIEAFDKSEPELSYSTSVYFNFSSVLFDDKMNEIEAPITDIISNFSNDVNLDGGLFKQIKTVYDKKWSLNLNPEQEMLLEKTYKIFTRNGALLNDADKKKLAKISTKLSQATTKFGTNVLDATNNFEFVIDDKSSLDGLPDTAIQMASDMAEQKGYKGKHLLTLHAPSIMPVLTYAKDRDLREKMWRGFTRRGTEAKTDNRPLLTDIIKLREEKIKLLGYETYADYVLEDRMAGTKETVFDMINGFKDIVQDKAKEEFKELQEFTIENNGPKTLKPWDMAFYSEKLKQEKYGFDSEELRPYFKFDNVAQGAFDVAGKLYNLDIVQSDEYPKYHKDTETYEIKDKKSGDIIAVLYTDFIPRETKRPGAWMSSYRDQSVDDSGNRVPPIICIHGNFSKPIGDKPALLTFDEVITFFHEFGHGLHGALSDVTYESLSGTSVKWDFVELPSQIMENWPKEKEILDQFAKHYETGEKIPDDMLAKMKKSENYHTAMIFLRQLRFADLDMTWHTTDADKITDVEKFELETCKEYDLMSPEDSLQSAAFTHLFSGGYAAGYYSYKWAEILDADAFEAFKENGLFDRETADKFRKLISSGSTVDPSELYKEFRGRAPDSKALLRREGLLDVANKNDKLDKTPKHKNG